MPKIEKTYLVAFFLYLTINALFILKYASRIGINPLISCTIYMLFTTAVTGACYINIGKLRKTKLLYWSTIAFVIALIIVLHKLINPNQLQVDRWSAIHNFLTYLFQGQYPYAAQTHLGGYGSPFPMWQAFHIPFFLLGNVSLAFGFVILILAFGLLIIFKSYRKALAYIVALVISPAFWYEVAVRSDLLYNFIICFLVCAIIFLNHISIKKHPWALGILCGLFLSTRFSVVIPFAMILFPDFFGSTIKNKLFFIVGATISFCLTFLPFIIWDWNSLIFFKFNPFVLQTRQGSIYEVLLLLLLIISFSVNVKGSIGKAFIFTAFTIVIFVSFTFAHRMLNDHFQNGLFSPSYDITYFNMALPFVIYLLAAYKPNDAKISNRKRK